MKDFDLVVDGLPWVLSALSLAMSWLTGSKWRHVWLYGLFIQCLWLAWVLASGKWGFLPLTASLFFVYARNHFRWAREAAEAEARAWVDVVRPGAADPYRKELWRGGVLVASVDMGPVGPAADVRREEPNYLQECRRGPTTWFDKDGQPVRTVADPQRWRAYKHDQAEGKERIEDQVLHDYPACGVFRGGKCSCDAQAEPRWEGAVLYDPDGKARRATFNEYGHERSCSLMFPSTLGTEDDRCDCAAQFIPRRPS